MDRDRHGFASRLSRLSLFRLRLVFCAVFWRSVRVCCWTFVSALGVFRTLPGLRLLFGLWLRLRLRLFLLLRGRCPVLSFLPLISMHSFRFWFSLQLHFLSLRRHLLLWPLSPPPDAGLSSFYRG
jgi:hypothetical protein